MKQPVNINLSDGNLGNGESGLDGLHVKFGVAEGGEAGKIYEIASRREAIAVFTAGSLVDSLVRHFDEGGNSCYASRPENDIAGSISEVVKAGSGTAVFAVTGTPAAGRKYVVEIVKGGAAETAEYRVSQDGGNTFGNVFVTPAPGGTIALGNGISGAFSGDTPSFVAGDKYSFYITSPTASAAEFISAIDGAKLQYDPEKRPFKFAHIVGGFNRDFWEAVGSLADDWDEMKIHGFFVLEYPDKGDGVEADNYFQAMLDEARLFNHKRIALVGSREKYGTDLDFKSSAIRLCAVLSRCKVNVHPGYVKDYASLTTTEIEHWDILRSFADDFDSGNIITACKYDQWPGIYIKADHLMSDNSSDYQMIHELRPADKARRIAFSKIMPFVNSEQGLAGDTTGIEFLKAEIDVEIASRMEQPGESEINGHVTELKYAERTDSQGRIIKGVTGFIGIYKKGTNEFIEVDVGYIKEGGV